LFVYDVNSNRWQLPSWRYSDWTNHYAREDENLSFRPSESPAGNIHTRS